MLSPQSARPTDISTRATVSHLGLAPCWAGPTKTEAMTTSPAILKLDVDKKGHPIIDHFKVHETNVTTYFNKISVSGVLMFVVML